MYVVVQTRILADPESSWTKLEFYFGLGQTGFLLWSRQIPDLPRPIENSSLERQIHFFKH